MTCLGCGAPLREDALRRNTCDTIGCPGNLAEMQARRPPARSGFLEWLDTTLGLAVIGLFAVGALAFLVAIARTWL